jgi:hypothetical protein
VKNQRRNYQQQQIQDKNIQSKKQKSSQKKKLFFLICFKEFNKLNFLIKKYFKYNKILFNKKNSKLRVCFVYDVYSFCFVFSIFCMDDLERAIAASLAEYHGGPPPASLYALYEEVDDIELEERHLRNQDLCQICQESFRLGDDAKRLQCRHFFHPLCLLEWLQRNNTCPLCRLPLSTLDHHYEDKRRLEKEKKDEDEGRVNKDYETMFF